MPLDSVARRYAETLFSAQRDKLAHELSAQVADGQPRQVHEFVARLERKGVEFIEALAHSRADSLLAAYSRAQVLVDDAAVEEIFAEVNQLCEIQGANIADRIRGAAGVDVVSPLAESLAKQVAVEITRIATGIRLSLAAKRDEGILDARSAPEPKSLASTEARPLDDLVQLLTKGEFEKDLAIFVTQAGVNSPLSLLFADLDHFKGVNDSYGHLVGDEVLVAAAGALKVSCHCKGHCYRWGGEELAVLLPNYTCAEAIVLAERVREAIAELKFKGYPSQITASIGASSYPRPSGSESDLLRDADAAMYRAKGEGRNRVCSSDGSVNTPLPNTVSLSNAEISKRLNKVRLWMKLVRGQADNFILNVENKSDEKLVIEEVRLESDGIVITEPAFPPLSNVWILWPRGQHPVSWRCETDPSATLIRMNDHKGLPFKADLRVVLLCSLLEQSREFDQRIPVKVIDKQIVSLL
jgi:diguanylate cyclase (GGDEF)-like protein